MTDTMTTASPTSRQTQYLRVFMIGFSAFIFNTTEFVPVGLLSDIARDFSMSTADTGWMLTIYAWIVATLSLPLMMATGRIERKTLLLGVFGLFILSHIASAFATTFTALIVSRAGVAFAHAIFWSITASIAIRVAPPGKKTLALSSLATGTSLAMILGVPIGRMIGQLAGWRVTFAGIGLLAFVIMVLLWRLLPALPSLLQDSGKTLPRLLRNRKLMGLYLFIFLLFTAHYTAYSYIEPFVQDIGMVSKSVTTVLLLLFGGAGIAGSMLFSRYGESHNTPLLISQLVLMIACTGGLLLAVNHTWSLMVTVMFWGTALMVATLAIQVKVLSIDPNASDMIQSMYSGIINLGIGSGALIGSQVIQMSSLSNIGFAGMAFAGCALLLMVLMLRKYPELR
ncbi:sugar transporter [Vibrio zhugei]|uniref:Sugar transporter n=1 Tax=Vibrio zhugei TaxID=2479546 RepID=A0ABV7CBY7_9VIBR|nr:sugar transporter [Vibrio zhugei]